MKKITLLCALLLPLLISCNNNNKPVPDDNLQKESDKGMTRPDSMERDHTAVQDTAAHGHGGLNIGGK